MICRTMWWLILQEWRLRWAWAAVSIAATSAALAGSAPDAQVQAAEARIRALVGGATCRSDADCRSAPIGVMPCGGPEAYLAWSVLNVDERALRRALDQYAAARKREIARTGESSVCVVVLDPGVMCLRSSDGSSGRCTRPPLGSPPAGLER